MRTGLGVRVSLLADIKHMKDIQSVSYSLSGSTNEFNVRMMKPLIEYDLYVCASVCCVRVSVCRYLPV